MILPKHILAKSIHKAAGELPFLYWLKSVSRPIISPLNVVLSHIPAGINLIDIGCGNGTLLHLALKFRAVKYAYGYDVSKNNIKYSLASYPKNQCLIEYRQDIPDLNQFDVITLLDVLHHIPKSQQFDFVKKIVDKMKTYSKLILMDINASYVVSRWANQCHDLIISRQWVYPMKMAETRMLLKQLGTTILLSSEHRNLWYVHYLFVIEKQ